MMTHRAHATRQRISLHSLLPIVAVCICVCVWGGEGVGREGEGERETETESRDSCICSRVVRVCEKERFFLVHPFMHTLAFCKVRAH
jgi:hypothetical protein